jgi:hypothetical protein
MPLHHISVVVMPIAELNQIGAVSVLSGNLLSSSYFLLMKFSLGCGPHLFSL